MGDGMVERPERQPCILLRPQAPAQDAPGVAIHDHRQVPPGARHLQIRDVADPDLIRPRGQAIELAIGNAGKEPVEPRNPAVELHRPGPQPGLAHEPLHAPAAHPLPDRDERPVDSRTAIRPPALLEPPADRAH